MTGTQRSQAGWSQGRRITAALIRSPASLAASLWLLTVITVSVFPSQLAPDNPLQQDLASRLMQPSWSHILGTDSLGRDILSRLMYGGGTLLWGAGEAALIALLIGMPVGLLSGYVGGALDAVTLWGADVLFAVPGFVIIVAIAVIYPSNTFLLMAALGVIGSALVARLVRTVTRQIRDELFVDAAKVAGLSGRSIIFRHILPLTGPPALMLTTANMAFGVLTLASLSFLGLGSSPTQPSWGQMVDEASQNITVDPWLLVPSGTALLLTIVSFNLIASTIRDRLPGTQLAGGRPSAMRRRRRAHDAVSAAPAASPQEPGASTLTVRDLKISFDTSGGPLTVVDGVSLELQRGRITGLVGESGCGKSATAQAILGLLSTAGGEARGSVSLSGHEVIGRSQRQLRAIRRHRVAYISQEPMMALDPSFTIGSLLREAARNAGAARRDAAARSYALLRDAGISDPERVTRLFPHQISGGMAQRVCIAMALAAEPELIVADEPTTALDVTVQAAILDLFRSVARSRQASVLLVTHDFGVVADVCDDVAVMYAGQIVEQGATRSVLRAPRHPYTVALLQAIPSIDTARRTEPIPGSVPTPAEWPPGCRFAPRCALAELACTLGPIQLRAADHPDHPARCIKAGLLQELAQ